MAEYEGDSAGVNRALAALLAWPEIARSPQLASFLSYIVERRLRGDAQSIKAYSIAVDVFGRAPDFDPQADPIVRVQARRLRGLLDQYYRGPGADDPLRIQLPIGRYVPEFVERPGQANADPIGPPAGITAVPVPTRPRGHITLSWFVLLVLTLGAVAMTYSLATLGPRREQQAASTGALEMPRLRVMEFQNLTGEIALTPVVAALAVELVTDFEPLLIVDVAFGGRGELAADDRPDDFVLTGIVRKEEDTGGYQLNAILTDAVSNAVVWNWAASVSAEQITGRSGIDFVSQELILRLGGPRGPIHARAREFLAGTDVAGRENFYLCAVLFVLYRTAPTPGTAARLDTCFNALPESEETNGNLMAARASLLAERPLDGRWAEAEQIERYDEAQALIVRALSLAPTSSFVWEQQARLHEARGQHDMAQSAYGTALQLNAANIDATAAHARHLALTGYHDQAVPLARRAIEAVPPLEVPDWFRCVPALAALKSGEWQQAERLAEECGRVDMELGPIIGLLAALRSGDTEAMGHALPRILEASPFRGYGIMVRLGVRVTDEALLTEIREALLAAGVPETSLTNPY